MSSRGPLPFCSQCVKALVYFDVQACRLDIGNEKGDTPLHIAARWGYQGIIETLLQNGASTEIQNRLKETPLKCALNSKVAVFLSERQYDLKKYQHPQIRSLPCYSNSLGPQGWNVCIPAALHTTPGC